MGGVGRGCGHEVGERLCTCRPLDQPRSEGGLATNDLGSADRCWKLRCSWLPLPPVAVALAVAVAEARHCPSAFYPAPLITRPGTGLQNPRSSNTEVCIYRSHRPPARSSCDRRFACPGPFNASALQVGLPSFRSPSPFSIPPHPSLGTMDGEFASWHGATLLARICYDIVPRRVSLASVRDVRQLRPRAGSGSQTRFKFFDAASSPPDGTKFKILVPIASPSDLPRTWCDWHRDG